MTTGVVPTRKAAEFPPAPKGLSTTMKTWWKEIVRTYELESHHLRLLQRACQTWDLAEGALKVLQADGATYLDRFGPPKERPEAATWRSNVKLFKSLLTE